ncbi:quinone oxidoreductase 1 [Cocos nucifera]|uniref:Quinone oxidoreductase 1 n=1 Tax=Cocos nucifera TaxID=13894 RepID=A0A8K0IM23_COCNU|nr:quinone oxidoreductase 1 [Cocos nucifera]
MVLKWEDVEIGEPKEGKIRVKNKAIGVNFIDVYFRKGVYQAEMPFTPDQGLLSGTGYRTGLFQIRYDTVGYDTISGTVYGMEAVGVVTAIGPGLTGIKVGDIVAYAGNQMGSYAEESILPASVAVPVPPSVDYKVAASVMLKGMTAYVLLWQCFKLVALALYFVSGQRPWVPRSLELFQVKRAAQAAEDGCHHVIIYTKEDLVAKVNEITSGKGVNVVYDSVGRDTFQGSLACLMSRGYMISFGRSSGRPDPIPMSDLAPKSLFVGRPGLFHYTTTREELLEAAGEVFANVASGVLRVRINHTYALSDAARVHADLEARKTSGSIVLMPDS